MLPVSIETEACPADLQAEIAARFFVDSAAENPKSLSLLSITRQVIRNQLLKAALWYIAFIGRYAILFV